MRFQPLFSAVCIAIYGATTVTAISTTRQGVASIDMLIKAFTDSMPYIEDIEPVTNGGILEPVNGIVCPAVYHPNVIGIECEGINPQIEWMKAMLGDSAEEATALFENPDGAQIAPKALELVTTMENWLQVIIDKATMVPADQHPVVAEYLGRFGPDETTEHAWFTMFNRISYYCTTEQHEQFEEAVNVLLRSDTSTRGPPGKLYEAWMAYGGTRSSMPPSRRQVNRQKVQRRSPMPALQRGSTGSKVRKH